MVNPGFADVARNTGFWQGVPFLQAAVHPGAFNMQTDTQLTENTEKVVFPQIVEMLTKPIKAAGAAAKKVDHKAMVFTGTVDEVSRYFSDKKWSDGLAIIPPTIERVEEFLKYTDLPPDKEIAILPPQDLRATPWNIAVNGVMAGCRPEYMPILIAAVEEWSNPKTSIRTWGNTGAQDPYFLINGPLARQLNIDNGQGLISFPANQRIGRALGLIIRNIAGQRIHEARMGTFGYHPPMVFSEDEEFIDYIGWQPYHVEKGFDKNASTVSTGTGAVWGPQLQPSTSDTKLLVELMAFETLGREAWVLSTPELTNRVILVSPPVAELLASGGYTKRSLKEALAKIARKTAYECALGLQYGRTAIPLITFEETLKTIKAMPTAEKGKLPPWFERFPGWEGIVTLPVTTADSLDFIICGDRSRNKTQSLGSRDGGMCTREIKLPANWDELMAKLGYKPLKEFYLKK